MTGLVVVKKFTIANPVDIAYNPSMLIEKDGDMTEFESKCYGMSQADIRTQYMESSTARCSGLEMVVMGLLSDAQELMSFGHAQATDQARMNLNRAKYILSKMLEEKSLQVAN